MRRVTIMLVVFVFAAACASEDEEQARVTSTTRSSLELSSNMGLAVGVVENVGSLDWTEILLERPYNSMVVVTTPIYNESSVPLITRVQNVTSESFDVKVERFDGSTDPVTPVAVSYMVVEEGVYTQQTDGITMEAATYLSTATDRKGLWRGEERSLANLYTGPVVLGQVMTYNDPKPSVFWSRGSKAGKPPSASTVKVGKHIAEDTDTTRLDETIGYIVIEEGTGTIDGRAFEAGVGMDIVRDITSGNPASYPLNNPGATTVAVLSQAGIDGGNGCWPVLYGPHLAQETELLVAVDEDTIKDPERNHTTEQVAYFAVNQCPDPAAMGLECDGAHVCNDSGACVACNDELDCDDGNECTQETCDPSSGCSSTPLVGAPCYNGYGSCNDYGHCAYAPACYPGASGPGIVTGDVVVDDVDTVGDLALLDGAWCVAGKLTIKNTTLLDLSAFGDLVAVGHTLELRDNEQLVNLDGLGKLQRLLKLALFSNDQLADLSGLDSFITATSLQIYQNGNLGSLEGLNQLTRLSNMEVVGNAGLADISALDGLTLVTSYVDIRDNPLLSECTVTSLAGRLEQACVNCHSNLTCDGVCDIDGQCAPSEQIHSLASGDYHTCALINSGSVRCWGWAYDGRLGYGKDSMMDHVGDNETPAFAGDVEIGGRVVQIAADDEASCALLETGRVRCWGNGEYGQLGYGNTNNIGDDELPETAGDVELGDRATQIAMGGTHTCALMETGGVKCWGDNRFGQLGYGHTDNIGDDELPSSVGEVDLGGATVVELVLGSLVSCVLLDDGNVRCWGANTHGNLGYGHTENIGDDEPLSGHGNVPLGGYAVQLDGDGLQTCALLDTGGVRCWGYNSHFAAGYGTSGHIGDDETPADMGDIDLGGNVSNVQTSSSHACALMETGHVRCWGWGYGGRLGYGNENDIGDNEAPSEGGDLALAGPVRQLELGYAFGCVTHTSGDVSCWGHNTFGILGYAISESAIGDDEFPITDTFVTILD